MYYYDIGQINLNWEGPSNQLTQNFMDEIQAAYNLLDSGNFAAAQGPLTKAIKIRATLSSASERQEADRFLLNIINPKLKSFGFQLQSSAIQNTIKIVKNNGTSAYFGKLPSVLLGLVAASTFIGAGVLFYHRVLKRKK